MIAWEEPPRIGPGGANKGKWLEALTPVMERPGQWARVRDFDTPLKASTAAGNLRRTGPKGAMTPPGKWQFASCAIEGGGAVYARYIGPEDEAVVTELDVWRQQA